MEIIPADASGIARAADVLAKGGIVVHPTETCYGIAANMLNEEAVARLFAVKQRPTHMPVSALFPSVEATEAVVVWNAAARTLAEHYLPGPLTIILPVQPGIVAYSTPGTPARTLGVRVTSHTVAAQLSALCHFPISTTSANIHGHAEPYTIADVTAQFTGLAVQPDLLLDAGALPVMPPSTVVSVAEGAVRVVRPGAITLE